LARFVTGVRSSQVCSTSGGPGRDHQHAAPRRTLIAACVLAIAAGGCGEPAATIKGLTQDSVLLAFGDSLTSGKGVTTKEAYPPVLSRLTGYKVINAGLPGELSSAGLERLPSALASHRPDLVILCHGGNDMLQKRDADEVASNLDAMIAIIKQSGADVILIGVPEPGIFLGTASFYEELARQHRIPCDEDIVAEILADASLKSDYVHPNAQGYRRLAESVAALIGESQS
jgi:lysophospholipase L1-like esterase